jgi:plasmid stabilization system protein ParE
MTFEDRCGRTDRALSYVRAEDPVAADRMAKALQHALDWIGRWPTASREVRGQGVRTTLVVKYQYRIFYIVRRDEIVVRNIRSTRQRRPWERK